MSKKPETLGPYQELIEELAYYCPYDLKKCPVGRRLLAASREEQRGFVLAAIEWFKDPTPKLRHKGGNVDKSNNLNPRQVVRLAVSSILERRLPLERDDVEALLEWATREYLHGASQMIKVIEDFLLGNEMTLSIREKIERLIRELESDSSTVEFSRWRVRLRELSGRQVCGLRSSKGRRGLTRRFQILRVWKLQKSLTGSSS